jgi:hypothetical protein
MPDEHRNGVPALKRLRRILILIGAVAAIGPLATLSAGSASANSSAAWCDYHGGACLQNEGFKAPVDAISGATSQFTENAQAGTWQGHTVYELQDTATHNCLEFSDATHPSGEVIEDTCVAGRASQEWWPSNSETLVNVFATGANGSQQCVTGNGVNNPVYVGTCNGGIDQYWNDV